jgi:sulfate permease, SulP family
MGDATQPASRPWPILRGFAGWSPRDIPFDVGAGLTLAAIAVPEQMATARLGGFPPEIGFFVFGAGTLAFAIFGANRHLSSGADSTITPIFAGALGALAVQGTAAYAGLTAALALSVGVLLIIAGIARLGWIASFLSVPVTTGFLAGISVHIVLSQLPALLGIAVSGDAITTRIVSIASGLHGTNPYALALGALVFGAMVAAERLNPRIPGALVGLAAAIVLVALFHLEDKGVAVVGATVFAWPHPAIPIVNKNDFGNVAAMTLLIGTIVMVQTAATTRAFTSLAEPQDVNRDFIGVGAGSALAGALGLFPVNASPPRTAAVVTAGGRSQFTGILAAVVVIALAAFGSGLLRYVPLAALAGVLLAIALRIARFSTIALVWRQTRAEFALILATMVAIIVLPIQIGVAFGISLSVLHGIWTITRTRAVEFERVPGTTVWWPPGKDHKGEKLAHIRVVAFQAPLSFLNADAFRKTMIEIIERDDLRLIVFEASSVVELDFTSAQVLLEIIERCREAKILFAIARLTSLRAQQQLVQFGISEKLGPHGLYHSVNEAICALAPDSEIRPNPISGPERISESEGR